MAESVECVVIGAGVVGLACARALALAGREVILLESAEAIGTGTSSRNSEVVHAGIYYPAGSLKARLCVAGRKLLYRYCHERHVETRRCGKLIVAVNEDQLSTLQALEAAARRNGVDDLVWLDAAGVRAHEPELRTVGGLLSPSSGIVDSHGLMLALLGEFEAAGGFVAYGAPVERGRVEPGGLRIEVGGAAPMELECRMLVNSAGLSAPLVASRIEGLAPGTIPTAHYCKGNYFALSGMRAPFSMLVYPVPEQAGLGIHATIDLGGQVKFGPDVEWVDKPDYEVDTSRLERFEQAIRFYWPGLPHGALVPAYAGVRPKIVGPGAPSADFVVQGEREHGIQGLVNLFGIESPGLTASLALASAVLEQLPVPQPA